MNMLLYMLVFREASANLARSRRCEGASLSSKSHWETGKADKQVISTRHPRQKTCHIYNIHKVTSDSLKFLKITAPSISCHGPPWWIMII